MATKKSKKPAARAAAKTSAQKKSPARKVAKSTARRKLKSKGRAPAATKPARPKQRVAISHHRDEDFKADGLRAYAKYRDLGIAAATGGQVICHLVKANPDMPPEDGTGWHRHDCDFQIVIMMKGWARFMYEDKPTLVQAGDVVHQRPGIVHYLFDYSPDMEYLEIVSPADFKTVDMPPATDKVPPVTPWK